MQNLFYNVFKGKKVLIRADQPGIYVGILKDCISEGETFSAYLTDVRWLWDWDGSATIAEIASIGVKNKKNCRFPKKIPEAIIQGGCSMFPVSEEAWESIESVPEWLSKQ